MHRIMIFYTLFFGGVALADTKYIDFSGNWNGTCIFNGRTSQKSLIIEQIDSDQLKMANQTFYLKKTTSKEITDEHNGDRYREITIYDFKWNDEMTEILTSAKWLGWYLDKNGSWSGEGTGKIYMDEDTLYTQRSFSGTFGSGEESCEFSSIKSDS